MIYLQDINYLRLSQRPFYLPIIKQDKKHGSAAFLLTPNHEASIKLMNNKYKLLILSKKRLPSRRKPNFGRRLNSRVEGNYFM